MIRPVVLLAIVAVALGQEIAKKKCAEYSARAKAQADSPRCKVADDKTTGVSVEPNEFPANVVLGYERTAGNIEYLCDATLISDDTLLTVGHCMQAKLSIGLPKWARLGVTQSTIGQEVEVKETFLHPEYFPGHDIGLIKLKEKVNSSYVPACLDTAGVSDGVQAMGIGRPLGSAYVELRKKCPIKAWVEVRPSGECKAEYSKQNISAEATLCTKDKAAGPGDCMSGALYVFREPCVHTLIGLSSFGHPCHNASTSNRTRAPAVYTRVSHYIPWIESVAWQSAAPLEDPSKVDLVKEHIIKVF